MKTLAFVMEPGRYVVAVSGGVDSMALLNLLHQQSGVELTVAHFDHGIRPDSVEDRRLVQAAAEFYGLPFVYQEGRLGAGASEATARRARYEFLRNAQRTAQAQAIITAHHQDDLMETAILNMLRGTGRKGLSSLRSTVSMQRPLLNFSKAQIVEYAQARDLVWHEDSTNQDESYARNYVRRRIMPRLGARQRAELVSLIHNARGINRELDEIIGQQLHAQSQPGVLDRRWFISLPHNVAREVMAGWLRLHELNGFDRPTLERLVIQAKTQQPNKRITVFQSYYITIQDDYLALARDER